MAWKLSSSCQHHDHANRTITRWRQFTPWVCCPIFVLLSGTLHLPTGWQAMQLCNDVVGENVSVLSEPIRQSEAAIPVSRLLRWTSALSPCHKLNWRSWKNLGCWFERPQGGRSCRGLLQVWVIKVELFVPLLEQQRLTTTTGRFHTLFYLPPKGEYQIPCEQDRRRFCWGRRRLCSQGKHQRAWRSTAWEIAIEIYIPRL